jgi:hypothetical protein
MDFLFAIARDFNVAKAETMFRQVSKSLLITVVYLFI